MSKNRDLLKEAIADAKSVKETAIANAKLALEEAFTPHLKSMMSAKLEEMDLDEDDVKEEVTVESKEDKVDEEINLDELLAELDSEEVKENRRTKAEEKGYLDGMKDEKEDLQKEDARTDAEEEGYEDGMKDEKEDMDDDMDDMEIDLDDLSEDDLKNYIESVIKDMVEAGELEPGDEFEEEDVEVEDVEDMDVEDTVDVDVEIDEAKKKEGEEVKEAEENLDEESKKEKREGDMRKPYSKRSKASKMTLDMSDGANDSEMKEELEAAIAQVNELKTELNEVNLLNAKLLYTNKIFKAKNLTEDKKVKVLKAFDNAKDVKHAKTIFETLNEGLLDNKSNNSRISEIRKGSASKITGKAPVTKKQPIVESDVMVARFKKLAGII